MHRPPRLLLRRQRSSATLAAVTPGDAIHLDLDGAWPADVLGLTRLDARQWGPRPRYIARKRDVEEFWSELRGKLPRFVLYGSGDFHHLAGMLIRRLSAPNLTLISFDNHPDWDIRPPYWSCGGWAARALHNPNIASVSVWGCGSFELRWPARRFADRRALNCGRLQIHAWAERQPPAIQRQFNCMTRENWRDRFATFAQQLRGKNIYVTIDMDCLDQSQAITNWENGLFTADDIAWALTELREYAKLRGADICGAQSTSIYARLGQRIAGWWDHPRPGTSENAAEINLRSLERICRAFG
jgi:arginase family enzyme